MREFMGDVARGTPEVLKVVMAVLVICAVIIAPFGVGLYISDGKPWGLYIGCGVWTLVLLVGSAHSEGRKKRESR